jgi:hypothetical protein
MLGPKRHPVAPASTVPEWSRSRTRLWSNDSTAIPDAERDSQTAGRLVHLTTGTGAVAPVPNAAPSNRGYEGATGLAAGRTTVDAGRTTGAEAVPAAPVVTALAVEVCA